MHFDVTVPTDLTDRQRQLLLEFEKEEMGESVDDSSDGGDGTTSSSDNDSVFSDAYRRMKKALGNENESK